MWILRNVSIMPYWGKTFSIYIENDQIQRVKKQTHTLRTETEFSIDAHNLIALPGLIDPHVHFRTPGNEEKEDWDHAERAALLGGVTTVFDMPNNNPPTTTLKALEEKIALIGKRKIDYRLWFGATENNEDEIKKIAGHPMIIGVKIYMASTTGNLLVKDPVAIKRIFTLCKELKLIAGVHAEDENMRIVNISELGRAPTVHDHCLIRNSSVELEGVRLALRLQGETGCVLYLCHISTPGAVELACAAKKEQRPVHIEVCPHHLWLNDHYTKGKDAGFFKMNPALRTTEEQRKLHYYLCEPNCIDTIGSDHAAHTKEEKQKELYDDVPSGVPGVQTLFPLTHKFLSRGYITMDHFLDLTGRNAARIFGLSGHKHFVAAGYDADIVLVNPRHKTTLINEDMATKCGWTPFNNFSSHIVPHSVITRGTYIDLQKVKAEIS